MTYRSLVIGFVVAIAIFYTGKLFFKDSRRSGFFTTFMLLGLFLYGFIYEKAEQLYFYGWWPFSNIHRYLLFSYLMLWLSAFIVIKKSGREFIRGNYFLNVFMIILLGMNITKGINQYYSSTVAANVAENLFLNDTSLTNYSGRVVSPDSLPDIYYVILDGYGRQDFLQKNYNYNNSSFLKLLENKGFHVSDSSQCNYAFTSLSLSSALNMSYLNEGNLEQDIANKHSSPITLISHNYVAKFLKQKGYTTVNIRSGYAVTGRMAHADINLEYEALNEFERTLLHLTIFRLDDLFGIFTYYRLKNQIKKIYEIPEINGPKFSFIHIVAPHPPYVFDKKGTFKMKQKYPPNSWEPMNDYVEQLEYISKVTNGFIDKILKTADSSRPKPIVMLQSDHGPWISSFLEEDVYSCRAGILNAYLIPDQWKAELPSTISPVNSFRFVFNRLFNTGIKILPNTPPNIESLRKNPIYFSKIIR